ncbi:MAG: putative tRNA (cytidine(34)-2'-O)-methyltransferase [Pirellulaceae bacterium]|nr:MAG: putative tRNA (cytidine(34)-2'-O)-methyltransferase [Pirellulaceae bacterium]
MTDVTDQPLGWLHIVLYQPEIPQNTGNIGRTCVALGAKLWIVRPAGFRLDSSQLRRAGMDYWDRLSWEDVANWEQLTHRLPEERMWLITKFATQRYTEVSYRPGDVLVFGSESSGLPAELRARLADRCLRIPMREGVRSLNLATSVGIVGYEAARQAEVLSAGIIE